MKWAVDLIILTASDIHRVPLSWTVPRSVGVLL